MKLVQVPLRGIELSERLVEAVTPYILEYEETEQLARDVLDTYRTRIDQQADRLSPLERDANADTYHIMVADEKLGSFNVVYDADETRLSFHLPAEATTKFYRLLRDHRIVTLAWR